MRTVRGVYSPRIRLSAGGHETVFEICNTVGFGGGQCLRFVTTDIWPFKLSVSNYKRIINAENKQ